MTTADRTASFSYRAVVRVLSLAIAIGAIASAALKSGQIAAAGGPSDVAASAVLGALLFLPPAASGVLSFRGSIRALVIADVALAVTRLIAAALWPPLSSDGSLPPDNGSVWTAALVSVSAAAAAVAWRPRAAWTFLFVSFVVSTVARFSWSAGDARFIDAVNAVDAFAYGAVAMGLVIAVKVSGQARDVSALRRGRRRARAAVAKARTIESERAEWFVHDSILATLLLAARAEPSLTAPLALEARRALDDLREGSSTGHRGEEHRPATGASEFVARLTDAVHAEGSFTTVTTTSDPGAVLPPDAAEALVGAAAEALRNSFRHAPRSSRGVSIALRQAGCTVIVSDDGPGFEPAAVPASRVGLRGSVRGRMAAVPGGSARVESTTGAGCRVTLEWNAE